MESLLPARPAYANLKEGWPRHQKLTPVSDAAFFTTRSACLWNALPRVFGASSTIHDYFQEWAELGVFECRWEMVLSENKNLGEADLSRRVMFSAGLLKELTPGLIGPWPEVQAGEEVFQL
jgi:transposase